MAQPLSTAEYAQLQQLMLRMWPDQASAPNVQSYSSFHTQAAMGQPTIFHGHPGPHPGSALELFPGFSGLGANMTAQVNQQRLASSAATQLRQPQLPLHGHCCRGPAIQPPPLARSLRIEDCISNVNGDPIICLAVKVYPPQVSNSKMLI